MLYFLLYRMEEEKIQSNPTQELYEIKTTLQDLVAHMRAREMRLVFVYPIIIMLWIWIYKIIEITIIWSILTNFINNLI